jgi:predicted nucleic acid-binding protein
MSVEFVDTNVLIYAYDGGAARKHEQSVDLLTRLVEEDSGALSIQVLAEFYTAATKKLAMKSQEAEEAIDDLGSWTIHRPAHSDVLKACRLHRRFRVGWWDAMLLNGAIETGCSILWSEDFNDGQRYGTVTVRNPFH